MDEEHVDCDRSLASVLSSNSLDPTFLLPQEKECPLCCSAVRYFYINLNEKFLMCENTICDFPFGCEELQFQKDEDEDSDVDEYIRKLKTPKTVALPPTVHTESKVDSSESTSNIELNLDSHLGTRRTDEQIQKEKDIEKNIKDIRELNAELSKIKGGPDGTITNRGWIENLRNLQRISGKRLLKPEEMRMLRREAQVGAGELRIDINNSDEASSSSTITIQVQKIDAAQGEYNHETNCEGNKEKK